MPVLWPVDDNDAEHDDPEDVNTVHDDDGCRDIPEFVFPGTRKKEKEDRDLKELLEAGTGFVDEKGGTAFTSRSRLRREVGITGLMADARLQIIENKSVGICCSKIPAKDVTEEPGGGVEDLVGHEGPRCLEPFGSFEGWRCPPPNFMKSKSDQAKDCYVEQWPVFLKRLPKPLLQYAHFHFE